MASEFKRALDALGMTPTEYHRATGLQRNHCFVRARGERDVSAEVLCLMWALSQCPGGADRLREMGL